MNSLGCIILVVLCAGQSVARLERHFPARHGRPHHHQGGHSHGHSSEQKHSGERPKPSRPDSTGTQTPILAPATVPTVAPGGKCGLPNTMGGKLVVDWKKKDGLMYEYDVLDVPGLPTDPQEVNTMAKETLLGYVCLPGATVMVANVIREYSFVEVAQDGTGTHECVGHFVQSFAGADGQQNMTVFDSSTATTSRQLVYFQIYDDPSTMSIRYSCKKANLQTGICETPKVIVDIRKRPDQLTAAEKAAFDARINAILAPYCISTKTPDFEKSTFLPQYFPCRPPASPAFEALKLQNQALPATCGAKNVARVTGKHDI